MKIIKKMLGTLTCGTKADADHLRLVMLATDYPVQANVVTPSITSPMIH